MARLNYAAREFMEHEMKHKHAELLHYAAENADAMFIAPTIDNPAPISHVVSYPLLDWHIYPTVPKVKWTQERMAYFAGKTIQGKVKGCATWFDIDGVPKWLEDTEYRIKPKTVTKWLWATANGEITDYLMDEEELELTNKHGDRMSYSVKLEWSATEFEVEVW